VLAGIPGAVVAVPTAAAIARAWPELRRPARPADWARRKRQAAEREQAEQEQRAEPLGDEHVPM
jgi:hypothetical protein